MPVKVRCECGKVMNVPDAARGRKVKCRDCGESVAVPAEDEPPRRKKKTGTVSVDDENFLARIDLDEAEHEEIRICPKCAARLSESDVECPKCRIDLETGKLSEKNKYKKKRGGPDPDLFYKAAWVDSWAFLKKNPGLAVMLAIFTAIAGTIYSAGMFMVGYCERVPVKVFWGVIAFVAQMAVAGANLQLWLQIIKATVAGKDHLDRFKFDFFAASALGIKMIMWPLAINFLVVAPLSLIGAALVALAGATGMDGLLLIFAGIVGGVYLLTVFAFPIAVIHMASRYTFKAYIPYYMARISMRNFAPVAWWWLQAIAVQLVTIAVVGLALFFWVDLSAQFVEIVLKLVETCGIKFDPANLAEAGFMFNVTVAGLGLVAIFLTLLLMGFITSFPMVYLMRSSGLLAYYRDRELETSHKVIGNDIAGFWVRYLGYLIDQCVCGSFVLTGAGLLGAFNAFMTYMQVDMGPTIGYVGMLAVSGVCLAYFILSESGPSSATMGQKAMGLMVVTDDYKRPITRETAIMRCVLRIVGLAVLGLGALAMLWDKEKKTLHDRVSKTRVVWRPVID